MTFTVSSNRYSNEDTATYRVPAQGRATHVIDPLKTSSGWYDVDVTVSSDSAWSRRYVGHLEDGASSISG